MSDDNSMVREPGRKIEARYENPIDNLMIMGAEKISPIFKRLNFTPNGITMLSVLTALGSLYFLYQKDTTQFAIYLLISYFFDVMEGYYARKYKMVTKNGDRFDHYKDILFLAIGVYIMYSQYNITNFPILIVVILGLYFLSLVYLGCQEVLTSQENRSDMLGFAKEGASVMAMDQSTCQQRMGLLKWFGPGSTILIIIMAVFYVNGDITSLGLPDMRCDNNGVVPGSNYLAEKMSSSDNTLPSVDTMDTMDIINNAAPYRLDTFEPSANVVDIGGMTKDDLDFLNDLRNFGSANIGTSTLGPYSPNTMVDRMIRD